MIAQQNWWQLSSIQIGGAICLPTIMAGQVLCQNYGFTSAVMAILLGNALLLILGLISVKMSHEKKKNTIENAKEYFGEKGVSCFAIAMAVSLLGWFGLQLNMMSLGVFDLLSIDKNTNPYLLPLLNIALGVCITGVAAFGIRAINLLADFSLPILIMTMAYAFFTVEHQPQSPSPLTFTGISLVIAMAIALVIDLPTYFRHAKSLKDGMISMFIIFGLAVPLLEVLGVYLAVGTSAGTILDVLKRQDDTLWNLWIAAFLILAGWTTNNLNIYSGSMCFKSLFKKYSERLCTFLFGAIGTSIACLNLLNNLEASLDAIGILITSMGGVVLTRYFLVNFKKPILASTDLRWHLYAWVLGIAVGFLSMLGWSLTTIPLLDAMLGASLGTCLCLVNKESYESA